jgi:hypothetical protein
MTQGTWSSPAERAAASRWWPEIRRYRPARPLCWTSSGCSTPWARTDSTSAAGGAADSVAVISIASTSTARSAGETGESSCST